MACHPIRPIRLRARLGHSAAWSGCMAAAQVTTHFLQRHTLWDVMRCVSLRGV